MEFKLRQIIEMANTLSILISKPEISAKLSYRIAKILKKVYSEKEIYDAFVMRFYKNHNAKELPDGNLELDQENPDLLKKWRDTHAELINSTVKFDVELIPFSLFENIVGVDLYPIVDLIDDTK